MKENKIIKPYIGITGFTKNEEVNEILSLVPTSSKQLLMIGVLANWNTVYKNKESNRYPNTENIAKIFPSNPLAINLIHYDTENTKNLHEQLLMLNKLGGKNLHGIQLNLTWPPKDELRIYRSLSPNNIIVLVITSKAFYDADYDPNLLVSKIQEYKGLVDYILLDQSGGYGIPINTELMMECIEVFKAKELNMGIGVAGGLSPTTLNLVEPLIKEFPDLSIDAEDKLRDDNDCLNLNIARDYLCMALQIYDEI